MEFSKNYSIGKTKTKTGWVFGVGVAASLRRLPLPKKTGQPNQNGIAPILGAMVRVDVLF